MFLKVPVEDRHKLRQRLSDIGLQGRVSAAIGLLVFGPQPLTQAIGAALITRLSYQAVYGLVAAIIAVVLAAISLPRNGRRPRRSLAHVGREPGAECRARSEE